MLETAGWIIGSCQVANPISRLGSISERNGTFCFGMFPASTFCMNTMSILSALSDSGLAAVGNVVFPLTFPEFPIGEDEDSHVALFDATDRWYDDGYDCSCCGGEYDWYESNLWSDMWDDIEAAQRQADRDEEMKASWLRGEWHTVYAPHWFRDAA